MWTAGGGAGQISNTTAPNGATAVTVPDVENIPVHWHSGNGKSGATHSNTFPTVYSYSSPGGCYGAAGHTHNVLGYTCYTQQECQILEGAQSSTAWCTECDAQVPTIEWLYVHTKCGMMQSSCPQKQCPHMQDFTPSGNSVHTYTTHTPDYPQNTWTIGCGYSQGQIYGFNNTTFKAGDCYFADGFTPTATLTRTGNGMFNVKLMEQSTLSYNNGNASNPFYMDGRVDLTILDNVVCFYKRR